MSLPPANIRASDDLLSELKPEIVPSQQHGTPDYVLHLSYPDGVVAFNVYASPLDQDALVSSNFSEGFHPDAIARLLEVLRSKVSQFPSVFETGKIYDVTVAVSYETPYCLCFLLGATAQDLEDLNPVVVRTLLEDCDEITSYNTTNPTQQVVMVQPE